MGRRRSTRGEEAKREEAEWNLAQYGAEFRTLAESCPAAILIAAGEKLVFVNPAFESITNFSREEALSLRFYEVVHPDMRELAKKRGLARQKGEEAHPAMSSNVLQEMDRSNGWISLPH